MTKGLLEQVQRELEAIIPIRIKDRVIEDSEFEDLNLRGVEVSDLQA